METVIALVLFLSILTGCAGETLTNVKSSSITPNAAQTDVALQTSCEKFSYNLQKRNGA